MPRKFSKLNQIPAEKMSARINKKKATPSRRCAGSSSLDDRNIKRMLFPKILAINRHRKVNPLIIGAKIRSFFADFFRFAIIDKPKE